jgi:hypothetical protein
MPPKSAASQGMILSKGFSSIKLIHLVLQLAVEDGKERSPHRVVGRGIVFGLVMETKNVEYGLLPAQPLGVWVDRAVIIQGWRLVVLIDGRTEGVTRVKSERQTRKMMKNMAKLD